MSKLKRALNYISNQWKENNSFFRLRLIIAVLMIPIGPLWALSLAKAGEVAGAKLAEDAINAMASQPWVLMFLAAGMFGLMVGTVVLLMTKRSQEKI